MAVGLHCARGFEYRLHPHTPLLPQALGVEEAQIDLEVALELALKVWGGA